MKSKIKSKLPVVVIALFMAVSGTSFSQTSKFSISINSLTTNFNYGKSNSGFEPYKKNYRGFQAGLSYQAGITPAFSIVPEIYFAMKGGILKDKNPLTGSKTTLRINSLEMPVLARFHINKFYLNAGPYMSYNVGGRVKAEGTSTSSATTTKVSFGNQPAGFKRWDFGFQAGAGYNFNLKQSVLTLDVRYGYGLMNISRDVERYNRMLNISLVCSKPQKKMKAEHKG